MRKNIAIKYAFLLITVLGLASCNNNTPNTPDSFFNFSFSESSSSYIISANNEKTLPENIVIPSKHNGYPVSRIGLKAFYSQEKIKSVSIPSSITSIGEYAFFNTKELKSISIPNSVTSIEKCAFQYSGIKSLKLSNNLQIITYGSFNACRNLQSVVIPAKAKYIEDFAFESCSSIESIRIQNSEPEIGMNAFANCNKLKSINIPEDSYIDTFLFSHSDLLKGSEYKNVIYLGDNNNPYTYLYKTKDTTLTTYEIHPDCKIIGSYAFQYCNNLQALTLNDGVKTICTYAFKDSGIQTLVVPDSITHINDDLSIISNLHDYEDGLYLGYRDNPYLVLVDISDTNISSFTVHPDCRIIANSALKDCSGLESVTLNSSITEIGKYAFSNCTSLQTITIPNNVTFLGANAFNNCSSLKSITLNESIRRMGDSVLYGCNNLSSLTLDINVFKKHKDLSDGWNEFSTLFGNSTPTAINDVYLSEQTTNIPKSFFSNCSYIKNVHLGDNVSSIEASAFGASGIKTISLPESLSQIGANAFAYCTSLTSIVIPNNVKEISDSCFRSDSSLIAVSLPEGLTKIGDNAFESCTSLKTINLPSTLEYIGDKAFKSCNSIAGINLPNGITYIGEEAFYQSSGLTSITIGGVVEVIHAKAFQNCNTLTDVVISEGVKRIENYAFTQCYNLEHITLPSTLEYIGEEVFRGCSKLEEINIPNSVAYIGKNILQSCSNITKVSLPFLGSDRNDKEHSELPYTFNNNWYHDFNKDYELYIDGGSFIEQAITNYSGEGKLKKIVLGDNVKEIPNKWNQNGYVEEIVLGNGVISIGDSALGGKITSIAIPDSLQKVGINPFGWGECLESITVGENNKYFSGDGYALYDKKMKTLYSVASALTTYEMPDTVTLIKEQAFFNSHLVTLNISSSVKTIEKEVYKYSFIENLIIPGSATDIQEYAFTGSSKLKKVTINEGVKRIPKSAFYDCTKLQQVVIPSSLEHIDDHAFYNCSSITGVFYLGTNSYDFDLITYGKLNESFRNATTYIYSENQPTTSGHYWRYVDNEIAIW